MRRTVADIQRVVARYFHVSVAELKSPTRIRSIARPRQIAMYLCRLYTERSLPEIGRLFGGRDHTTVLHALRKVNELRMDDPEWDYDFHQLCQSVETGSFIINRPRGSLEDRLTGWAA